MIVFKKISSSTWKIKKYSTMFYFSTPQFFTNYKKGNVLAKIKIMIFLRNSYSYKF